MLVYRGKVLTDGAELKKGRRAIVQSDGVKANYRMNKVREMASMFGPRKERPCTLSSHANKVAKEIVFTACRIMVF